MAANGYVADFRFLQGEVEAHFGSACEVQIGATTGIKAIIGKAGFDQILVAGGKTEKGAQKIQVAKEDCAGGVEPDKFTVVITSRGFTGKILNVDNINDVLDIVIGEPLSGDKRTQFLI